ncbi:MAG: ArsB/NhaD family transporter [Bacteroidota bacterium]|nr:MAG: ArsB/NhaD family transporter [Bacteroidota bacterium]
MLTDFISSVQANEAVLALSIFVLSFFFITTEKFPTAITAMMGAFLLLIFRILSQEEAVNYIDFDTMGLLCGMMITVAVMRKSGIFELIAVKGVKFTKGDPWRILVVLSIVTGFLSAFLDNVTTVLIIVPLTFAIANTIKINPTPILIGEIIFSNLGGTATLIGDPPNIMIGGATHLGFMDFIYINTPVVVVVSVFTLLYLRLVYYKKLKSVVVDTSKIMAFDEAKTIRDRPFFMKSIFVFSIIILAFVTHHFHHVSLATIALGGGFILLLVNHQDPEEILKEVEWPTLFFFLGLFVLVGGLEKTGIIDIIADKMLGLTQGNMALTTQLILWLSSLSTTIINSIPFTATMISVIESFGQQLQTNIDPFWWALSLGACFGGNGTLIGAAANILVAGLTQKTPYPLRFKEYMKVGIPVIFISTICASLYLYIRFFAFN